VTDDELRASDSDRQEVAVRLNTAVGEGRLGLDEFSDRIASAYRARTQGELEVLVRDLPTTVGSGSAVVRSAPERSALTTRFGGVKKSGRWLLARETTVAVSAGPIKLDLREAELTGREVTLDAHTTLGSIKVWVPQGVRVHVDGVTTIGTRTVEESDLPPDYDVPTLHLRLSTGIGTVKVYRT
jgi:hypothetical protein